MTDRFAEIQIHDIQIGTDAGRFYCNARAIYEADNDGNEIAVRVTVYADPSTTLETLQTLLLERSTALLQEAAALPAASLLDRLRLGLRSYEERQPEFHPDPAP